MLSLTNITQQTKAQKVKNEDMAK